MTKEIRNRIVYSLPGEKEFRQITEGDVSDSAKEVIVQPFATDQKAIRFEGSSEVVSSESVSFELYEAEPSFQYNKEQYKQLVKEASRESHEGKIVVSRIRDFKFDFMDLGSSLMRLRQAFPNAFVYAMQLVDAGTWVGATPEILVRGNRSNYQSVALAGTVWDDRQFGVKETEEQALVMNDISDKLEGEQFEIRSPKEMGYGPIRHLKSDVHIKSGLSGLELARKLHPTSAIAGLPMKSALQFIQDNEVHNRELYTGYLGLTEKDGETNLFVNLRCMQLFRGTLRFYVGGGVNARSEADVEWEETERKMNAVLAEIDMK